MKNAQKIIQVMQVLMLQSFVVNAYMYTREILILLLSNSSMRIYQIHSYFCHIYHGIKCID